MKIIELQGENFKRLRAVSITPKGNMVEITGRNEQGKTSVLDLIWAVLGGGEATKDTPQPIRKGEKTAKGFLNLGDLLVTRKWTEKGTSLTVTNGEGAVYPSPQSLLDKFLGKLSFDPLAFCHMKAREQRETLLGLVKIDLDLEVWAIERQQTYDARTIINRKFKETEAQIGGLPTIPEGTPDEEVSAAKVLEEQTKAQEIKEENDNLRRDLRGLENQHAMAVRLNSDRKQKIDELEKQLTSLKQTQKEQVAEGAKIASEVKVLAAEVAKLQDPDLTIFAQKISEVEATNHNVRIKKQRQGLLKVLADHREKTTKATTRLEELDSQKTKALEAAKFPIGGLSFDDEGVTYKRIPFSQCSSAERLRVSLAMAMALNPKIRVLRITDGSLLDNANLQVIREMVEAQDYQLWIERVDDSGKIGVVIEDGQVIG